MTAGFIPVPGTDKNLQTFENEVAGDGTAQTVHSEAVTLTDKSGAIVEYGGVIDSNNTTELALTAGSTYTGTATDMTGYSQTVVQIFGRPGVVAGDGSSAKASFYFEFSKDGTNWDTSVPHLIRDPSLVIPVPIIFVHKYFRVKYVNDGGVAAIAALGLSDTASTPTTQTVFRLTTYLHRLSTKELTRTLDQGIAGSDPVILTRSAVMAQNANKTIVNTSIGGTHNANSSTTPLGSSATFTGAYLDLEHYIGINVFVLTNVSGTLLIDNSIDGVTVDRTSSFSIVANTSFSASLSKLTRYIRIRYTNDGVAQTSFRLQTHALSTALNLTSLRVDTALVDGSIVTNSRAVVSGKDPISGLYANITRTPTDGSNRMGQHVGLLRHEVATPIKSLTGIKFTRTTVTTTASLIISSDLTNRRAITIKMDASNSSSRIIDLGATSAVTSGTGYELTAGESLNIDLQSGVAIYAITNASTGTLSIIEGSATNTSDSP